MALTVVAFVIMLQFSAYVQASASTDCAGIKNCEFGEDANVLLQSKAAIVKEMELAMDPHSEEEGHSFPSQTETLLQSVLGMAQVGKNATTPDRMPQLQAIKAAVNTLMPALTDAHAFAQTQLDASKQEVDDCLSDTNAGLATVATKADKVAKAEAAHRECRFEEKTKKTTMNDDCNALKSFVDTSVWQPIPAPRDIDTFRRAADEYDTLIIRLRSLDSACNISTAAHVGHKATCDGGQATFESHFCEYRSTLADLKPRSDKCYSDQKAEYDVIAQALPEKVLKWKAEYKALKKIICYLDVWLSDGNHSTINADVTTQCQDDKIDTTAMDIAYPVVPPPTNVDVGPIAEYPGTNGWINRYQGLPPHNSEVVPCIPATTTTTTTAGQARCYSRTPGQGLTCKGTEISSSYNFGSSSVEQCRQNCNSHMECMYLTFYNRIQRCYLYSQCDGTQSSSESDAIFETATACEAAVSWSTVQANTYCSGNWNANYYGGGTWAGNGKTTQPTADECKSKCAAQPGCIAISYGLQGGSYPTDCVLCDQPGTASHASWGYYQIQIVQAANARCDGGLCDVALVTMSSEWHDGGSARNQGSNCIDGNVNPVWNKNSCCHTGKDADAWIKLDLGGVAYVSGLRVTGRQDYDNGQSKQIDIITNTVDDRATGTACASNQDFYRQTEKEVSCTDGQRHARYVWLTHSGWMVLCEIAVLGSPQAPYNYVRLSIKDYPPHTWNSFQSHCETLGGNLVSIHSAEEDAHVCQVCGSNVCYIGAYQTGSEGTGGYSWIDGSVWDYTPSNRADNWVQGGEDVLGMFNCKWGDSYKRTSNHGSQSSRYFICKI